VGEVCVSIVEMTQCYVAAIRAEQANGPYYLCGYSLGGLVAVEIAAALQAAGERVDMLVILDTTLPAVALQASKQARLEHWLSDISSFVEAQTGDEWYCDAADLAELSAPEQVQHVLTRAIGRLPRSRQR